LFINILEERKMSLFRTLIQKVGIAILTLSVSGSVLAADFNSVQVLAESGDISAQLELAERYQALAKLDTKTIKLEPSELYYEGKEVDKNARKALSWYLKSANQGNAIAQEKVGAAYHNGTIIEQDYSEAFKWYQKAIKENVAEAQFGLAILYDFGTSVPKDLEKSKYWYQKARDQGYGPALFSLAYDYHSQYDDHKSQIKALELFQQLANEEDQNEEYVVRSQYALGFMYYDGYGTEKDYFQSAYWYQRAAEQEHGNAQQELARMYSKGEGVKQNHEQAMKWYKKAAGQGYILAQTDLAWMYYHGEDIEQDYAQTFMWLNKIVESGKDDTTTPFN